MRIVIIFLLKTVLTLSVLCPDILVSQSTSVTAALSSFEKDNATKSASWGFYAKNVETNEILGSRFELKSLRPASSLKVITTASALAILGEEYCFETQLSYDGYIDAVGVLQGNLYIVGSGDPSLGTNIENFGLSRNEILNVWAQAVEQAGIKSVNGKVVGDAQYFETAAVPNTWVWEDLGNYFGAGAVGLSFSDNRYNLYFSSGTSTGKATSIVDVIPAIPNLKWINEVKSGAAGSGDNAYIFASPYSETAFVRGTIPPGKKRFRIKGSVLDPALFCADQLHRTLNSKGITISETPSSVRKLKLLNEECKQDRILLYNHQSPPLKEIVKYTNKQSINLFAEHLLKAIGKRKISEGTTTGGLKVIENYWKDRGISFLGTHLKDGSGLSPLNAINAKDLTEIIRKAVKDIYFDSFMESLPIAGDPSDIGFLKSFLAGTSAAKKVFVKSGYIAQTRAFCGYAINPKGEKIAFAFLVNNYNCNNTAIKQKMGKVIEALCN